MVESLPYHWQKVETYHGRSDHYHYFISVNPMSFNDSTSFSCSYVEEIGILSINGIKFKVSSLEDAGSLVKRVLDATNLSIAGTIYEPTIDNTTVEWVSI